ncbi:MAG: amidohydrolase [Clostridia bacterium]|nr:amidohydrolase [Clostridia bacterium]
MSEYAIQIRRKLHMYPEVGFELPLTLKLLREELDKIGVEYTEDYGKSSIVATVNPEKSGFTIGVRADTDALPMTERNDVPYKSKIDGHMHACGHDAHTAVVLDTLRRINEMRDKINCRVKFLFQSAEESAGGARLMAEDGVMDDIDCIVALHCDKKRNVGEIGISAGPRNANSDGFRLDFYGKSAHAARQQEGIDAIAMAVQAYTAIEFMIAKEFRAKDAVLFNVGTINGGTSNNIISEHCSMFCTLRTWSDENAEKAIRRIKCISESIASTAGGRVEYTTVKHYPFLSNDEKLTALIRAAAEKVVGSENIAPHERGMGGEDFAYFARLKPGCMFRLGIKNEEKGINHDVHTDKFDIDEDALEIGSRVFIQFILDNMNGINFDN